MQINAIELDENEMPSTVTVKLRLDEVILFANLIDNHFPQTATVAAIGSAFHNVVFNNFFEDGLEDARSYGVSE